MLRFAMTNLCIKIRRYPNNVYFKIFLAIIIFFGLCLVCYFVERNRHPFHRVLKHNPKHKHPKLFNLSSYKSGYNAPSESNEQHATEKLIQMKTTALKDNQNLEVDSDILSPLSVEGSGSDPALDIYTDTTMMESKDHVLFTPAMDYITKSKEYNNENNQNEHSIEEVDGDEVGEEERSNYEIVEDDVDYPNVNENISKDSNKCDESTTRSAPVSLLALTTMRTETKDSNDNSEHDDKIVVMLQVLNKTDDDYSKLSSQEYDDLDSAYFSNEYRVDDDMRDAKESIPNEFIAAKNNNENYMNIRDLNDEKSETQQQFLLPPRMNSILGPISTIFNPMQSKTNTHPFAHNTQVNPQPFQLPPNGYYFSPHPLWGFNVKQNPFVFKNNDWFNYPSASYSNGINDYFKFLQRLFNSANTNL